MVISIKYLFLQLMKKWENLSLKEIFLYYSRVEKKEIIVTNTTFFIMSICFYVHIKLNYGFSSLFFPLLLLNILEKGVSAVI